MAHSMGWVVPVLMLGVGPVVAQPVQASAQGPAATARLGRCFTPVTTTGVYFEVAADGPTERLLNMTVASPRQTVKHSHQHQPATATWVYAPPIHAVPLRRTGPLPTLLSPQRVAGSAPITTHRHDSVLALPAVGSQGETLDVVAGSEIGAAGCRVRLRHVVR